MVGRLRRWLVIGVAAVAGVVLAVVLVAHLPWTRTRALAWASDFVARFNLDLEAGSLSYNALTRRISVTDVRLAARGFKDRPFLTASRIEVTLPLSVLRRRFAIDHLAIDGGIVDIVRDRNNVVNLPPSTDTPPSERAREIDIRSLTIDGLDVQYEDQFSNWGVKVPRIESMLRDTALGARGTFAARGGIIVRLPERVMTLAPFETVMTFDGSNVSIEQARLSSPEIEAFLSGPINRVLDSPALDLSLKGRVHLDQAIAWVPPPPVPVAGLVAIEGSVVGPARNFAAHLSVRSNTLAVGRERDLTFAGPVHVTFKAFSGEGIVITPRSGGSVRARFNVPWAAERTGSSDSIRASISTAEAEWRGVDSAAALRMADVDPQAIGAAFEGRGTFEFGEPRRFVIENRSTGRPPSTPLRTGGSGVVPMTGTINVTIVGDDYRFDHRHSFPGFDFEGQMAGRIVRGDALLSTMNGPAHARVEDVAQAAVSVQTLGFPVAEVMFETRGAVDAPMTLGGSYRNPKVDTTVSGDAVDLPLLGRVRASVNVVADTGTATMSAIDMRQGSSSITGEAVANITARTWSGKLHVEAPNAAELQAGISEPWRVDGALSADASLGGTFDHYTLDTVLSGRALRFAGQPIDRASAKAMVTPEAIDVSLLELHQGAGYLAGRVRYAWETGAYDATLKGSRLTWQGTLLSTADTQALLDAQFTGSGTTAQPKGQATLDFTLTGGEAGVFIGAGAATADLLGDHARIAARLPMIGASISAEVATASPYDYTVNAQLDRFELARLSPLLGAIETEIRGFANGTVTGSGRLADDRDRVALVNITELDAGVAGVPVSLLSPLNATLRGDDLALKDLSVRVGSGRLSASGSWHTRLDGPSKPQTAQHPGRLEGALQAQFAGDLQDALRLGKAFGVPVSIDGSGPMQFDLRSNGTRLGTSGTLSITNGMLGWVNAAAAVQSFNITATLNGEQLEIDRITGAVAAGGIVGNFSATGAARLPGLSLAAIDGGVTLDEARFTFSGIPVEQQRPSRFVLSKSTLEMADLSWTVAENPLLFGGAITIGAEDPALDLSLKGLIDLRVLSALTSAVGFDGNAEVNARVEGTVAKPMLGGRITLDDAEIAIADPRVVLSDLTGSIVLEGPRAVFDNVRGTANGGKLIVDGPVKFEGLVLSGGELNIQAEGVAIELPKGLRSELGALLTFRLDPRNPSLTGDIRVNQSAYTETITLAALARQAAMPVAAGLSAERPYAERLALNLSLTTTDDLILDNNYGRVAAGANVRILGTVAAPGMDGRVTLREDGQIFLAGRTFRIARGDVSFTDRRHIHPEFNIAAEANLGAAGGNVTLTLTGSLEHPTIDLTAEDGSLTPGEIAAGIVGQTNTETALTLLSADLLGVTGRAIGLDAFRVERGAFSDRDFRDYADDPALIGNNRTDPTTRLTIGKRLSDKVEFTASQNLRENGKASFVVSYFPRRNVELRALSRDSGTVSVGVRHQITFGRGTSTPPSERRVRPTISAITVTGVDAATAAASQAAIRLEAGDAFDFLALQNDIDRIRDSYQQRGYLEARVRTRRTESDDARSVAIEFVVNRGPRSVLQVDGLIAPAGLVQELEQAWHKNVFDQFLIEDLTNRVRRHLVNSGDLGSIVVGRIDRPAPDTKRLRIEVTPGAPVSSREIRFAGNLELNTDRLNAEIRDAGLELDAWLDRTLVERALRQAYNEAGFLEAEVAGRPLTIDGTTGVLWIDIKEGPRTRITGLRWTGVGESRLPEIQKATALTTPSPFVIADVTEARRRIEDYYRREGFNGAEVEVQPALAPDDTVAVTFNVSEGVQQVLQSVELKGNAVTNDEVLTQALRFEFGTPVNFDEWTLARKRLYDTNVFRSVDIQPLPDGDPVNGLHPVKASVTVEEIPAWSFRYGVQLEGERRSEPDEFTSTRNAGVVAELRNPNLFGRALTGGVFGMYQRDRQDATVFVASSRLFGWSARSTLYGFYAHDRLRDDAGVIEAVTDRQGISVDQRWRPKGFQLVYGYRFEQNHTVDPRTLTDFIPFDFTVYLAKLNAAMLYDRRDDPINPRRGFFSSASFDQAAPFLGSDVNNRKLLMQQFAFVPIGRLVLASRAQLGFAFGRDPLALSDRFRAGGATSVRGYGEESLGPRDRDTKLPSGGDRLVILNQEARFPLYRWANGVAFLDAGNIFAKGVPWTGLEVGYGAGLRFDTPIGLIRGDVGFPRGDAARSRRSVRWYFGFGHIF